MIKNKRLIIIGGGAAGFMAAISCASNNNGIEIFILEQSKEVLEKVRISGGGRCNVTHSCFDVKTLINYYPRGNKELLSPFTQFNCEDTFEFFESKGVKLKTEADGRVFPVTDDSLTIVNCLKAEAKRQGVKTITQKKVTGFSKKENFTVHCVNEDFHCDVLLVASGSNPSIWNCLRNIKHNIVAPVPSLFSFNTKNTLFRNLSGISIPNTLIQIKNSSFESHGIVLITHSGLSGPAILKLSAFAARHLAEKKYEFNILINWIGLSKNEVLDELHKIKQEQARKSVNNYSPFKLVHRFWTNCLSEMKMDHNKQWANLNKEELNTISAFLCECDIAIFGKSTNKEEFVTAGGISLKEVNLKTMESKLVPGLFFAGEVLDIDAVTGGFNFQAAWTTGYIAGLNIA